ncbi:MAG TPA: DUF1573 domain-containing protein [Candidatus Paceibacterota bacterium]|nr:DUF1573 domain-containing protein [Candidatus Paceibacterota bacterium]
MNKNKILSVVTLVIIFGGIIWLAKPGPNQSDEANAVAGTNFSGTNSGDNYHKTGEAESGYALEAPETFYNFGEISMKNSNVKHDFTVKNNTSRSINIAKVYTSCMCTSASIAVGGSTKGPFGMPGHGLVPKANMEIPAGGEAIITAEFDPNAHGPAGVGRIEREIYLEDDAGAQTVLKFEAVVTP